jgi:hypothetical protein
MTLKKIRKKGPIFIVGMNGSGTTMLADLLNQHPMIFIPKFESKVIPFYYKKQSVFGDLNEQKNFQLLLNNFLGSHLFLRLTNGKSFNLDYNFETLQDKSLATIIDLTFSYFCQKENKIVWGDHSPKYAACLPMIVELFPNAKIIHIIRDGRDCVLSFRRRFKQNIYRSIYQWKKNVKKAMSDGEILGKERYFELRYEKLTFEPEKFMRKLFSFLEIPFTDSVLKSNMPMYEISKESKLKLGTIIPNTGKWKQEFNEIQIKRLSAIAGELLIDLGYEVNTIPGDKDIPYIIIKLLILLDKINSGIVYLKNYDGNDLTGDFFRIINASIKQMKYYKY